MSILFFTNRNSSRAAAGHHEPPSPTLHSGTVDQEGSHALQPSRKGEAQQVAEPEPANFLEVVKAELGYESTVHWRPRLPNRTFEVDIFPAQLNQMLSKFLDLKYPSEETRTNIERRGGGVLLALPHMDLTTQPLLRSAAATLTYGHLGDDLNDQSLIHRGMVSYHRTLALLRRRLEFSNYKLDHRTILTAIWLLSVSSDILMPESSPSFQTHREGAVAYIKAHGLLRFKKKNSIDTSMFALMLNGSSVLIALSSRRSGPVSPADLSDYCIAAGREDSLNVKINIQGLYLAELVERTETFCFSHESAANIKVIWSKLNDFRANISVWFEDETLLRPELAREQEDLINVSDLAAFDMDIEEHCFMANNSTFKSFFRFPKIPQYMFLTMWWFLGLVCDCTILRLLHYHPWLMEHASPSFEADVKRSAFHHATQLCRTLYRESTFQEQPHAIFLDMIRGLCQNIFEELGAYEEFGWCQAIGIANSIRLERLVRSQARPLCRIGELRQGIISLSRFRAGSYYGGDVSSGASETSPALCPHNRENT